jgi:hypothetical protein
MACTADYEEVSDEEDLSDTDPEDEWEPASLTPI